MNSTNKKILLAAYAAAALFLIAGIIIIFATKKPAETPGQSAGTEDITTLSADTDAGADDSTAESKKEPDTSSFPAAETSLSPDFTTENAPLTEPVTEPLTTLPETTAEPEPEPITLGLYVFTKGQKYFTRVSDFKSRWPVDDNDIGKDAKGNYQSWVAGYWTKDTWNFKPEVHLICDTKYFFVIPSNEERIDFKNSYWTAGWSAEWSKMWTAAGLDGYKIGYCLETVLKNGETKKMTILDPSHTFENAPYCEVWLYDEIARPNGDHVTVDIVNQNTLLTDLKITLRNGCYDVDYFNLTAFVYDSADDFDSDGNYVGIDLVTAKVSASNR